MSAYNLIDFLERHDADDLATLRNDFPEAELLLRSDKPMGDSELSSDGGIAARAALAEKGQLSLRKRADAIVIALTARLRRARNLRTFGSVLAAASSAGLVASFAKVGGLGSTELQLTLAVLAFASSVLTIFADLAAGGSGGGQIGGLFDKAVALSSQILAAELRRQHLTLQGSVADWDALLVSLDEMAIDMHNLETTARVV